MSVVAPAKSRSYSTTLNFIVTFAGGIAVRRVCWCVCVCVCSFINVLGSNILETAGDRNSVTIENL